MFYVIYGKRMTGVVATTDGVVTHATGNLQWAHGKHIDQVLGWLRHWSSLPDTPLKSIIWERYRTHFVADAERRKYHKGGPTAAPDQGHRAEQRQQYADGGHRVPELMLEEATESPPQP